MVDREKVIKGLQCCGTDGNCGNNGNGPTCPYFICFSGSCVERLINDALDLLKEQESITKTPEFIKTDLPDAQPPQAPKVLKYTRPASEFTSLKENIYLYYCGWCGIDIRRGDYYCRNCGRKVDWNDRQRENDS